MLNYIQISSNSCLILGTIENVEVSFFFKGSFPQIHVWVNVFLKLPKDNGTKQRPYSPSSLYCNSERALLNHWWTHFPAGFHTFHVNVGVCIIQLIHTCHNKFEILWPRDILPHFCPKLSIFTLNLCTLVLDDSWGNNCKRYWGTEIIMRDQYVLLWRTYVLQQCALSSWLCHC